MNRRSVSSAVNFGASLLLGGALTICLSLAICAQSRTRQMRLISHHGEAMVIHNEVAEVDGHRVVDAAPRNLAAQSRNQWRPLANFDEGDVRALFAEGGRVYAGTVNRGVFISTDNGRTWSEANAGLATAAGANRMIDAFVSFGGAVIAGGLGGVFRTTDGGQSWTASGSFTQTVFDFAVMDNTLYAGAFGAVFRSSDGLIWTSVSAGLPAGRNVNAIEAVGNALVAGTSVGVYRSTDGGQSWAPGNAGLPNNSQPLVRSLAVSGDKLYLGTSVYRDAQNQFLPQVYVSNDQGQNWSGVGQPIRGNVGGPVTFLTSAFALLAEGANLYSASSIVAANSGADWTEVAASRGLPVPLFVYALARAGGTLLAGTDSGIFALAADGASWAPSQTGLKAANPVISVSGDTIFAVTLSGALFYSRDNGQSWTEASRIPPGGNGRVRSYTSFAVFNNAWYYSGYYSDIYRSTDNGQSWTPITEGLAATTAPFCNELDVINGKLHAVFRGALYVLNESGNEWARVGALPSAFSPASYALMAASGTNVYVLASGGRLFRSTDSGVNFTQVALAAPEPPVYSVRAEGDTILAGTGVGVFVSANNGQSWTAPRTTFDLNNIERSGSTLYAAAIDGMWFSTNGGLNWTPINAGLTHRFVNTVAVKGETLLVAAQGGGVFSAVNPSAQPTALASVSAASFAPSGELAPESIVAAFGSNLAPATLAAATTPLPTAIAGNFVMVRDSAGAERRAPLFFVSPAQVNYQVPPGAAAGRAAVYIASSDGGLALGESTISGVAPGIFAANANGQGVAAAVALRIKADGSMSFEPAARFDPAQNRSVAVPIDLGPESDQVFLLLFGTGIRFRSGLSAVSARIGGLEAQVTFAGAQGDLVGADQINVRLPRSLAGRGDVEIVLIVDGKTANTVRATFR